MRLSNRITASTRLTSRRWAVRGRLGGQRGFSLIELLIAVGLLSFVALGILPMMMRSMADNNRGWEATQASNFAQSALEPVLELEFENPSLTLAGTATELFTTAEYADDDPKTYGADDEGWFATGAAPLGTQVLWNRTTRVRQFGVRDLNTPVDGNTDVSQVQLKEVRVQLNSVRQAGALGAGQDLYIRVMKAF